MMLKTLTGNARLFALIAAVAALASCGGGGGGGSSSGGSASGGSGTVTGWVSGVFSAASSFKSMCQTVRTGVDIEGNAYTDKAGTTLDEKNWLRSWSHETYLWNTEVTDTNPASSTGTSVDYFNTLKTTAKTASGKDKDEFHFSELTTVTLSRRNSVASGSYGADFVILSGTVPRDVRVKFTEPGSPAEDLSGGVKKLIRGTQILTINGVDLVNGGTTQAQVDAFNAALFPSAAGIATTFTVRDPGTTTVRTITVTSQNVTPKAVNRTRVLTDTAGNKTGYVLLNTFNTFSSEREITDAMTSMSTQGVKDLVLDLRYNGGGLLAVASELSYMVAGDARTNGKTFERLRFNALAGTRNPVSGGSNDPVPFYKAGLGFSVATGTALPSLNLPRVFVLTTDSTCSASEAVINGLRGVGVNVVQIGGKTCGKPYGFYPQDNCGQTYYTVQFQGVNEVGFGDYADGFIAANSTETSGVKISGCTGVDDFAHELGDSGEGLLKAALGYASTGTCPALTSVAARSGAAISNVSSVETPALIAPVRSIMDNNRDMTMPKS
jgi:carboxyl-terminal processing protease